MKPTHAAWWLGLLAASGLLSCAGPEEPALPDGRIVLRFESGSAARVVAGAPAARAAATFDSVAVRVFRSGTPLVEETSKGKVLSGSGSIELTLACFAEDHKRVSVELFSGGAMTYHGANTDVNVPAGQQTAVNVDAYEFMVDTLQVSPPTVQDGESFALAWNAAAAAAWYQVQSSSTPNFATIEWQQAVTDTVLDHQSPPGSHYFRVIPRTQFARGTAEGPEFAYVSGASGSVTVTGFDPPRVIPGERFAIVGENLDYPGTTARIGFDNLPLVRATWDSLVVTLPLTATTNTVTVTSPVFGSDTSNGPLVALRVAYVTLGNTFAAEYVTALEKHSDDFGTSGVAVIPIGDVRRRDMNVFDIIVVASDTGTKPSDWGGGDPALANVIAASRADVLAIGRGGATFLDLVATGADVPTITGVDADRMYYMNDTAAPVFNTPHKVNGPDFTYCQLAATTVALDMRTNPIGVNLYASTDKSCFILCSPNNEWALADFRFDNPVGQPVIYAFLGYAGNPAQLTTDGSNVLGNVMFMLYQGP